MNNEIRTGKSTMGEYAVAYKEAGYGAIIPIIDGTEHPELLMSYVSDADREAGLTMLAEALRATGGNVPAAMEYMYHAAMTAAKGIRADESIVIDDKEIIIDYDARKAYYMEEKIADMEDISVELDKEAVKAILVERAKNNLPEDDEYDEDDEDDDYGEYDEDVEDDYEDNNYDDDNRFVGPYEDSRCYKNIYEDHEFPEDFLDTANSIIRMLIGEADF